MTHYIIRASDGANFKRSSSYHTWGCNSKGSMMKNFMKNVKPGDIIWWATKKSNGKVIGVAQFDSHRPRTSETLSDETLGWVQEDPNNPVVWDTEIRYSNLYNIEHCTHLLTYIKSQTISKYDATKCNVNLIDEYSYIIRYLRVSPSMD